MKLIISALITAGLTILFRYLDNKGYLGKIKNGFLRQLIVGIVFGLAAIYATEFGGIALGGATMNARDAAPLCAGIYFGPVAGITAGIIGGIERYFCVYWGGGAFTQLACSLACVLAGLFSAVLRKFVFLGKRPKAYYSIILGLMCEDVHMFLVFVTNDSKLDTAFSFVKKCSMPMILSTIFALFVAFFAIEFMERGTSIFKHHKHSLLSYIQLGLLAIVIISFILTAYITVIVQIKIAEKSHAKINEASLLSISSEVDALYSSVRFDSPIDVARVVCSHTTIGENGQVIAVDSDGIAVNGIFLGDDYSDMINKYKPLSMYKCDIEGVPYYVEYIELRDFYVFTLTKVDDAIYLSSVSMCVTMLLMTLVFSTLYIMVTLEMKYIITDNMNEVNNNLEAITAGELDRTINVRRSSEFEMLSDSINAMVNHLKDLIEEAKNRIAKELEFARSVQLSSLTTEFDLSPSVDIFARTVPAKEVGGDFYDAYMLDDTHMVILIADVSGKGIPAAMFMMRARTNIKALAQSGIPINEVFTKVNNRLCHNNSGEMFITSWMGILDIDTGVIEYVNAGHNPPVIKRNGTYEYLVTKRNLVLAAMEDYQYKSETLTINDTDEIFLYTDGVTEAININEELFGEERLLDDINSLGEISAEEICTHIFDSVNAYAGEGVDQFDDITMLSLRFRRNNDNN